jgi:hypothetical protein
MENIVSPVFCARAEGAEEVKSINMLLQTFLMALFPNTNISGRKVAIFVCSSLHSAVCNIRKIYHFLLICCAAGVLRFIAPHTFNGE